MMAGWSAPTRRSRSRPGPLRRSARARAPGRIAQGGDPVGERLGAQGAGHAGVVLQAERGLGRRESYAAEHFVAVTELGRLAAQELAPRRGIEIEVLDRDRGALGARRGLDLGDARAFRADHARALRLRAARCNRKA